MNNSHKFSFVTTVFLGAALVAALGLLEGCPSNSNDSSDSVTAFTGSVYGGRQPVAGSLVTAYMAGQGGMPAPVIGTATTGANGTFSIPVFSPAPGSGAIVYLTAFGGDGSGSGNSNTAILLGTVAGICASPACSNLISVNIDELSTAAMAYGMGGFTSITGNAVNITVQGSDANALTGLANAAKTFANLVNPVHGTGRVPGTSEGGACTGGGEPVNCGALRTLDTLANIAAACVNSPTSGAAPCTSLFSATTTSGGFVPANTYAALYTVVTDPEVRNDGSGLFALNPQSSIYLPGLGAAPNAWTVALNYTGNELNNPAGLAIDADGAVWLTNTSDDSISKFANDGTGLGNFTNDALDGIHDVAVDRAGNVWVTSQALLGLLGSSLNEFDNAGNFEGSFSLGLLGLLSLGNPQGLGIGPGGAEGTAWVATSGVLNLLLPALASFDEGTRETALNLTGLISSDPRALAVDANSLVWVADGSEAVQFSGGITQTATASGNGLGSLQALAVDSSNNLWVANGDGSVSAFTSTGAAIGHWSLSGSGAGTKDGIALDANGEAWASNSSGNSISLFTQSGGLLGAYGSGGLNSPQGIAPDSSGNLWVANEGDDSLTEFVGLAAPTVTPIAGALVYGFTP